MAAKKKDTPKKEKAPKAQEMSLEELAESGLEHAKLTVSEDQKEEYAPYIGYIVQRYPSTKILRAADVSVTVFHFVPTTKSKGVVEKITGPLTDLDPNNMFLAVDGQKIKFSNMYRFIVEGVDLDDLSYSSPQSGWDDQSSELDDDDTGFYRDEPRRKNSFVVDDDGLPVDDPLPLSDENRKFWDDDSSDFWPDFDDPFIEDTPADDDDGAPLRTVRFSGDDDCQIPYGRQKQEKPEIKPWRKKNSAAKRTA